MVKRIVVSPGSFISESLRFGNRWATSSRHDRATSSARVETSSVAAGETCLAGMICPSVHVSKDDVSQEESKSCAYSANHKISSSSMRERNDRTSGSAENSSNFHHEAGMHLASTLPRTERNAW